MSVAISVMRLADQQGQNLQINRHPDECAVCRKGVDPLFVNGVQHRDDTLEVVYRCPRHRCESYFIAYFKDPLGLGRSVHALRRLAPLTFEKRSFNQSLQEISAAFCRIYNHAAEAESRSLQEVAGVGYRKALEFLIKDYLISQLEDKEKEKEIKEKFLGRCIKDDVDDPKLKAAAEMATWLGNDETHYERRWVDKDVEDLKKLIDITCHWIEMSVLTAQYGEDMKPEGTG